MYSLQPTVRPRTTPTLAPRNILVSNNSKSPVILTPNRNQQQQPSVKVLKVFSSRPPSSQSQTVSKPLVQIVPSPQGNLSQQGTGITPKVVSVQSLQRGQGVRVNQGQPIRIDVNNPTQQKVTVQNLVLPSGHKIHLQTPITQDRPNNAPPFQVKSSQQQQQLMQVKNTSAVTLQTTPVSHSPLTQSFSSPLRSPAMPSSYKPLESLQEVNRQATQQSSVVPPVSAVLPEANDSTKQSPTELRNQVTVRDRYRYIIPLPQTSISSTPVPTTAAGSSSTQLIPTSPVKPAMPVAMQPIASAINQVLQVLLIFNLFLTNHGLMFPLTLSLSRVSSKLRKKILNFILQNCQKQTVPHESTAQ